MDFNPDNPSEGISRDERGRFTSTKTRLDTLTKRAKELGAAYSASNATIERLNASLASSQKAAQRQVDNLTASFKQQLSQLRQHDRSVQSVARSTEGLTTSLLKAGAALWALHAAYRAVIHLAETKMGAALLAGPSAIPALRSALPAGVPESKALSMLGQLFQSPALRFGTRGATITATGRLTEAVKGLGDEGVKAVGDFVRSLEPKAQQGFIQAVNSRGVAAAVNQFTSAQNYGLADAVKNALDIQAQANAGTLDPLLASAVKLSTAFEKLTSDLERFANAIASSSAVQGAASFAAEHPWLALGGGAAAVMGGKAALTRGLPWAIRGLFGAGGAAAAGGAAQATGTIPTILGFAEGTSAYAAGAGAAGAAGAGILGTAVSPWLAVPAVAAGVGLVGYQGYKLRQDLQARDVADAATLAQSQRLTGIGDRNAASLDELTRLRGQRQIEAAQIARYETEHRRGTFKQFWGAAEFSDADKANIEAMRDHYARLQKQIDDLQAASQQAADAIAAANDATKQQVAAQEAAKKAADEERDRRMREQFATHQQAALEAATAASAVPIAQTALQQQQLYGGLTDILNRVQLTPEQRAYQDAIQRQVDKLTAELATIDTTSEATKEQAQQQANAIVDQLAKLRGEQKAIQKAQFDLGERDYGDKLTLMRQQLQIAEATPIGWLGAGKELHELQAALQKEIQRLNDYIARVDQSTTEGQRQAREAEIKRNQLVLELKQSRLQELQALLDNAVGQAAQAGRFSKIIFDKDQNLEAGLRKGIVNYDQRVVGNITGAPEGWGPRTMNDVIRARQSADVSYAGSNSSDPAVHLRTAAKVLDKAADAIENGRDIESIFDPAARHHPGAAWGGNVISN